MDQKNISTFMYSLLEKYSKLRGRSKNSNSDAFWDVAVITTADESQKLAYEIQIDQKRSRGELPVDLPLMVVADPPGAKIGNGGSTLVAMETLHEKYGEALFEMKIIIIHAGGWSQRMPSASVLGKIFTALPHGEPVYQMLDLKLALYWPFVRRMEAGVFVACADDILTYNLGDEESWSVSKYGFTALGHPSSMSIGNTHGVYVVSQPGNIDKTKHIVEAECLEVLQKPSDGRMEEAGAILPGDGPHEFADGLILQGKTVYTDSSFFFGVDVMKKLLELKKELGVLTCEIDAYGDFLQALGPRANEKYIHNTSNISEVTQNLTECRLKVFHKLKNTNIHLILMNASKFNHIGTTHEYLYHLCEDEVFRSQMCFQNAVFNNWQQASRGQSGEKRQKPCNRVEGCVLHSSLSDFSTVKSKSVVEYCHFERPVVVGGNCVISSCQLLVDREGNTTQESERNMTSNREQNTTLDNKKNTTQESKKNTSNSEQNTTSDGGKNTTNNSDKTTIRDDYKTTSNNSVKNTTRDNEKSTIPENEKTDPTTINIPSRMFIHTVAVCSETMSKYVTVFFQIDENLKKAVPNPDSMNLSFMGTDLKHVARNLGVESFASTGSNGTTSLWNVKIFPSETTMSASFLKALEMIDCIKNGTTLEESLVSSELFSFADLLKSKDINSMISYRQGLFDLIQKSSVQSS